MFLEAISSKLSEFAFIRFNCYHLPPQGSSGTILGRFLCNLLRQHMKVFQKTAIDNNLRDLLEEDLSCSRMEILELDLEDSVVISFDNTNHMYF